MEDKLRERPNRVLVRIGSGDIYTAAYFVRFDDAVKVVREGRLGLNLMPMGRRSLSVRELDH
jgi:hypothetical protein